MRRAALLLALLAIASSCAEDFESASKLSAVRILGVRSDTPYVRPGATFHAEVLAYDGRANPIASPRPMRLFWLRDVCLRPSAEDCYRDLETKYPPNQDLTPLLTEGDHATFTMPADAAPTTSGDSLPTTSILFVAACAGHHLELVGRQAGYPTSAPFACVDSNGRRLGADDFVFAFMRFYVSNDLTNANPTPSGVTLDGVPLSADNPPLTIPRCTRTNIDDCPARKLAVTIGDESQEIDPTSRPPGGEAILREQVWSSFFVSSGKLGSEALVLFDARRGRSTGKVENEYRGPLAPGDVDLFVVTHDNRSGASFQSFKIRVE